MTAVQSEPIGLERSDLLLVRLGAAVARLHAVALAPTGLTPRKGAALLELREHGPMSQQALGDAVHTDPSNLVALLNDLEDAGLASRRRDSSDRRRHIVEISESGAARLSQAERALDGVLNAVLADLDADERNRLHALLSRVAATALGGAAGDEATAACDLDSPVLPADAG